MRNARMCKQWNSPKKERKNISGKRINHEKAFCLPYKTIKPKYPFNFFLILENVFCAFPPQPSIWSLSTRFSRSPHVHSWNGLINCVWNIWSRRLIYFRREWKLSLLFCAFRSGFRWSDSTNVQMVLIYTFPMGKMALNRD